MPTPFGRQSTITWGASLAHAIAIIFDNLQVMLARDLDNFFASLQRRMPARPGSAPRVRRRSLRLRLPEYVVQRFRANAPFVHLYPDDLGAHQLTRATKPGVREVLDQHDWSWFSQDRLEHHANATLPAMCQYNVIRIERTQRKIDNQSATTWRTGR